jgi:hypothetical protein
LRPERLVGRASLALGMRLEEVAWLYDISLVSALEEIAVVMV